MFVVVVVEVEVAADDLYGPIGKIVPVWCSSPALIKILPPARSRHLVTALRQGFGMPKTSSRPCSEPQRGVGAGSPNLGGVGDCGHSGHCQQTKAASVHHARILTWLR